MIEAILLFNPKKLYLFGDKVLWEEKERILVTGSSIGVPPSELYLLWGKCGE